MGERRQSTRQRSFLRGCIYFNNRRSVVDCLIRDISDDGAKIMFSDTISIPDVVDLYIPQKEQTLKARVQWRHGDEVGLAFGHAAQSNQSAGHAAIGEVLARIDRLEQEIGSLKRMYKRLRADLPGDPEAA
jgi:hypothetical protein